MSHAVRGPNGAWDPFGSLNGMGTTETARAYDVAIAGLPDGSAQVLAIGTDSGIYHRTRRPDHTWTEFAPVNGSGTSATALGKDVAIAGMPDGSSQMVVTSTDGGIYHRIRYANGAWNEFTPLNGSGTSATAIGKDVAIAGMPDGSAQIVAIGNDGGIYHRIRYANGAWSEFAPLNGLGTSATAQGRDVAIAGMPDGSAQVVAVGNDGGIYHRVRFASGPWSEFAPLNGMGTSATAIATDVAIAALPNGSAHLLAVGPDGGVYQRDRYSNGVWSEFSAVPGLAPSSPVPSDVAAAGLPDGSSQTVVAGAQRTGTCSVARTQFQYQQPEGTPYRFGGGSGYPDVVPSSGTCVIRVSTGQRADLVSALSVATPGSTVFVDRDINLNNPTSSPVVVPEGVTLAGNRGSGGSLGALLYTTAAMGGGMISTGAGARITGLRIRGHDQSNCGSECAASKGIVTSSPRLEVDNNEIFGWTAEGIALRTGANDARIHHNFFHHNQKQEFGYGVTLEEGTPSNAVIEWNRFNNNRHAVSGHGTYGQSYEARYNLVLSQSVGHIFDMHGTPERHAGTSIKIHHNYILHTKFASVLIRGVPQNEGGAWIWSNCIARARQVSGVPENQTYAIAQSLNNLGGPFSGTSSSTQRFWSGYDPTGATKPNNFSYTAEMCGVKGDL